MSIETRIRNTGNQGGGGGGSSDSAGLAGTGGNFITFAADPTLSNEKVLTARSAMLIATDGTAVYLSATSDIPLARVGTSQYFKLQDYANFAVSAGKIAGGNIATSATTFNVTSGNGFIKATDSDVDTVLFFDWPALAATGTTQNTSRFIGVEYNAGSPQVIQKTSDSWNYDTEFPLGIVVNDSGSLYVINNPWGTSDAITNVIERFDSKAFVERDNRVGGLILSDSGTRRVIVSAGTVLSRLSEYGISAINTTVAGSGTFDAYYRDGAGGWTKQVSQAQWDNASYDDGDGTLGAIPALQYSSKWFYLMADSSLAMLYGQAVNAAPAIIFDESPPASVPDRVLYQGLLIGRFVFQAGAASATRTETAFGTAFTSAQVEDHGELSGLSDNDHPQYVLTATTPTYVLTSRLINTTSPVGGGGNLSADRTLTVGSLTTIGSSNQLVRVNSANTPWEYATFRSGSSTTVTHGAGFIQVDATTSGSSVGIEPAFSVHKNGSNQAIADVTWTLVQWHAEDFDTDNNFANSRFSPTRAGKYNLFSSVYYGATSDGGEIAVAIYKNSTSFKITGDAAGGTISQGPNISVLVNATTADYFEVYTRQISGASQLLNGAASLCFFMGSFVRD